MKYFAGLVAIVALVCGATVLIYNKFESDVSTKGNSTSGQDTGVVQAGNTTTFPTLVPAATQVIVTGTITALHVEKGRTKVPMPLTINTANRGEGAGATIAQVTVDDQPTDIEWDAGTPLNLDGPGGAIVTAACTIDVDPTNTTIDFGLDAHGFAPGTYTVSSPVAIGTGSLAKPADQATFVDTDTGSIVFRGDASAQFPTISLDVAGSDGKVDIKGDLDVLRPDGSQTKYSAVSLPMGKFTISVLPAGGKLNIHAVLEGDVTTT